MCSVVGRPAFIVRLAAAVMVAAAIVVTGAAQVVTLRLVSTAWPPFTNPAGQPRVAIDVVSAALEQIGVSSATTIVPDAEYTPALLRGPFDGSAAAWRDAQRDTALLFSEPYLINRLILVGRVPAAISARSFAELKGKRVALVDGYSYGDDAELAGPTLVHSARVEDSLRMLLDGAVDYTLMDQLVVEYLTDRYPEETRTRLVFGPAPLLMRPLHLAIRRSAPNAQGIIDRFNRQIKAMMTDGSYHQLMHVDWIRADLDGDGTFEYVPHRQSGSVGEPQHVYDLSLDRADQPSTLSTGPKRYYVGGNIYTDWASVPDQLKSGQDRTSPSRNTASILTFSW